MIGWRSEVLCFGLAAIGVAWPAAAGAAGPDAAADAASERRGQPASPARANADCSDVEFSVSLDESSPETYRIAGELCRPRGRRAETLEILIHGASYNRSYWDFPFQSRRYSFVRHANRAGFATLAIDRLGSGESDRPPPELVTVHASAFTIHQLVSSVRSGVHRDARGKRLDFERIVLVGHSFGSNISWTEAGIYGDVDGLILTGISHDEEPPGAPLTQLYAYPARFDPKFADAGLPDGYLTTIPGRRGEMFYHLPGADPRVIAVDEAKKDTLPVGMLFDQFTTYGLTQQIQVPVLNVIGDFDTLACQLPSCTLSGSVEDEASYYPDQAEYTQIIVPRAGHSLNLHRNAPSWYGRAQAWVEERIEGEPPEHCGPDY